MIVTTEGSSQLIDGFPDEKRELVKVPIELAQSAAYSKGHMFMKYPPVEVKLEGELLGEMSYCLDGGLQFTLAGTGEYWYVSARNLWEAFMRTMEARGAK